MCFLLKTLHILERLHSRILDSDWLVQTFQILIFPDNNCLKLTCKRIWVFCIRYVS